MPHGKAGADRHLPAASGVCGSQGGPLATLQAMRAAKAGHILTSRSEKLRATAPNRRAKILLNHGKARHAIRDVTTAIMAFDQLVASCPIYAEGKDQRAWVRSAQGDPFAALVDLDAALACALDHPGALAAKARALIDLDRIEDGRDMLRRAVAVKPCVPERYPMDALGPADLIAVGQIAVGQSGLPVHCCGVGMM